LEILQFDQRVEPLDAQIEVFVKAKAKHSWSEIALRVFVASWGEKRARDEHRDGQP